MSEPFTNQSQISGERLQEKKTVVKIPLEELSSWLPPALRPPTKFQNKRENDPYENSLIPQIQPPIDQLQESQNSSEKTQTQLQISDPIFMDPKYTTIQVPNEEKEEKDVTPNVIQPINSQIQQVSMVPQPLPSWPYSDHPIQYLLPPPPPPPLPTQLPQQSHQQHFNVPLPPPQEQLWHPHPHHPAVQLLPQPLQPHPTINRQPSIFFTNAILYSFFW